LLSYGHGLNDSACVLHWLLQVSTGVALMSVVILSMGL
jgi:hypothetical protein